MSPILHLHTPPLHPSLSLVSSNRQRITLRETPLMPIGIDWCGGAGGIQFGDLRGGKIPAHGAQILA